MRPDASAPTPDAPSTSPAPQSATATPEAPTTTAGPNRGATTTSVPDPAAAYRRPDASMTLLTEMMDRPLDPSYRAEADRRAAAGLPPARVPAWRAALIAFLIGLLLVTAGRALRQPKDAVAGQKAALIAQIHGQQQAADALAGQKTTLQAQIATARGTALAGQSREDLAARLKAGEAAAGAAAVTGPGLLVTIDDAKHAAGQGPNSDPRAQTGADQGKVVSRDLLVVVNGLWQAGAEAISVNGQRLTATSAIRFAGDAILVDYRPLARPYVITAIGDAAAMESAFTHSDGGVYVQNLADSYGIRYDRARKESLTCPAGADAVVRHARPADAAAAAPTRPAPTSGPTRPTRTTSTETRP